ncbi:MAG: hypothetical protein ACO2PO_17750 [Candidatus Calescibacterium sp.]
MQVCSVFQSVLRASYLFPPRGIDDIAYHIPKIVENVIDKKLVKLPVELDPRFGFPISAQFLSQAYVITFHNLKFIDFTNFFSLYFHQYQFILYLTAYLKIKDEQ